MMMSAKAHIITESDIPENLDLVVSVFGRGRVDLGYIMGSRRTRI